MRFKVILAFVSLFGSGVLCPAAEAPALYTKQCANCHGNDGRGKTAYATKTTVPDLHSAAIQDMSDTDLYETIARGNKHRNYPHAYLLRGMKDQDIRDMVAYIRTMRPTAK
jgi:mono/diheme cytochrome c family protein